MLKYILLIILPFCFSFSQQKSSWEIWLVPSSYTINKDDSIHIAFGLTGYGPLDPTNIKITVYSDTSTSIINNGQRFDTFLFAPKPNTPKNLFSKPDPRADLTQKLLESDYNSGFDKIAVVPRTAGDKKIIFVATYSPDSISWFTTSREFNYHVNSIYEQNQILFTVLGLVLALFAVGPLNDIYLFFKAMLKDIYLFFKAKLKKRRHIPQAQTGGKNVS